MRMFLRWKLGAAAGDPDSQALKFSTILQELESRFSELALPGLCHFGCRFPHFSHETDRFKGRGAVL